MNVLSLFDGMSCGQIAFDKLGIKFNGIENKYFASKIDKYAIFVCKKNYPNTIHLGDIRNIKACDLPKIDILIGGSPCQGFSIAGKQLNFEDERSKLFFEYVRLLKECNPKLFLLENVKMKKEWQDIISEQLGVNPIEINSALVSGQQRKRLYWTNIKNIKIPENKNIYLKDILEYGFTDKNKSYCIDANYYKSGDLDSYINRKRRQLVFDKPIRIGHFNSGGQGDRIYSVNGKAVNLSANGGGRGAKTGLYETDIGVRKLTPVECERLQTIPDNYTCGVSNTQRYKMLGNGWTVDVIKHILSFINSEE